MLYIYTATGGYSGQCSDSSDYWAVAFITETDEVTMKERMKGYANELGEKYDHCDFLKAQNGGILFDETGSYGLEPYIKDFEATHIGLDEIKKEDLFTEETISAIIEAKKAAERAKREAEAQRKREQAERDAKATLKRIKKERPAIFAEIAAEDDAPPTQ